jgi:hypothetical protein
MSSYNYSYNVLINRLEAFAAGHFLIKRFTHGQIDLADDLQDDQYPFMHVVPERIVPVDGGMQFDFLIMFADIPRDKEYKAEYQREVISDCVRLGQDLIAEVKNGLQLFGFDVQLTNNPTFEPFMEEYKNTITGVTFTLSLEVPWDWSACDIPAVWSVGGSSTGGSGTGYGITLQTNGVNNALQNLLNLEAGANITITDNGNGTITIDSTGGEGDQNLQQVTDVGNSTTNDIEFGAGAGILFNNGARVEEGTTNGGLGGVNGVALKCSIDYELKWEAGRLYVMEQNGFTIREVSHTFNDAPSVNDDDTLGYVIGSRWILDNGSVYTCSDATTGAAVWLLESKGSVTSVGLSVPSPANAAFNVSGSPVTNSGTLAITANGTQSQYIDGTGALKLFPPIPKALGDIIAGTNKGDLLEWDGSKWVIIPGLSLDDITDVALTTPSNGQTLEYNGTSWVNVTPASGGTVTSVALTTPAAFSVTGSPITTSGTLAITGAGTSAEYVDGTGALQTMPTGLPPTGTAGGDLSGTYPNPNVDRVHGIDFQSGTPNTNDVWVYGGSPAKWQHQHVNAGIVDNDSAVIGTTVKDALNHLNTTKVETTRSISTSSPLSGGGDLSANRTLSIADAVADGTTKGAAAFTAADFNSSSGVISIDYTNGQKATAAQPGFLTAADWSTFNSKPATDTMVFSSLPNSVAAAGTTYYPITGTATSAAEAGRVVVMPYAGTLKNLYVRIGVTAQPATGSMVFTLRKNGANTAITVTFTNADGTNATKSDTTNSVTVAAGDTISIQAVNNATGTSGQFVSFSLILERS